jgi:hypothetical protein
MAEIHATYNKERLEKLAAMFDGDPRYGNPGLYVKEHFSLRRVCDCCDTRSTEQHLAAASVIVEGAGWVIPISIAHDGRIMVDLEASIPDQSNFLREPVIAELGELGIVCPSDAGVEYIIPIEPDRDAYFLSLRRNKYLDYKRVQRNFVCSVFTDATPQAVLSWDTEIEYDYEMYWNEKSGRCRSGFNVENEYFQWLAQHGRLVLARISDASDTTVALGYCVPGEYELVFVTLKRSIEARYRKYGLGNAVFFMLLDYIYDNDLLTPLNLASTLHQHKEIWRPVPIVKPGLAFANAQAKEAMLDRITAQ